MTKSNRIDSKQLSLVASIAIMNGRDAGIAVGELVADHKDPTNLLTKSIDHLIEMGVADSDLSSLTELRNKFKAAKSKGGKGAKALDVGGVKKFKVQVVNGRAFLRVPVDAFEAGKAAIEIEDPKLRPTMTVALEDDDEGMFIIVK